MMRETIACLCLILCLAGTACAQDEMPITDSDREHWSFAPLVAPAVPVHQSTRALGPVDAFIDQRLNQLNLTIAPPASLGHLQRRLYLDLTGLAPAADDRQRLAANQHLPDAYEREVDRVLASPACGEHLAQSWLDLARFAETDGFEHDLVRPEAWRYRDWVIGAINSDMPYDHFMRLQVAGDLMTDESNGGLATTFCLAGPDMPDLNDQEERRHNLLNEMTATVGSVLLGLQLGCAACHDHKYDPLSQADFYRLRGVLATGVPQLVRDKPWHQLRAQKEPAEVRFYHRGDHRQPTVVLTSGVPRIAGDPQIAQQISIAAQPRMILAQWLASQANPLPARVMANRIWQNHFGRGLAATPSDLGLAGIGPTHPELLDWLAVRLREQAWSGQRVRRDVVLSATYRSQSLAGDALDQAYQQRLQLDPDNSAYSRYPRRRLSGEVVRDCLLQAAGGLNRQAAGPSVRPPLPKELLQTLLPNQWKASLDPAEHARRSVYVFARRNLRYPIFEAFDRPDAGASCPVRGQSVTATQSLLMLNSELVHQLARSLAERLAQRLMVTPELSAADLLWDTVLGRPPTQVEYKLLESLLAGFENREDGLTAAALGLFNSNEFIYLD